MKLKLITIGLALNVASLAYTKDQSYICSNNILKTPLKASEANTQVNFTNWADYISPDIIPCFSKLSNTRGSIFILLMTI